MGLWHAHVDLTHSLTFSPPFSLAPVSCYRVSRTARVSRLFVFQGSPHVLSIACSSSGATARGFLSTGMSVCYWYPHHLYLYSSPHTTSLFVALSPWGSSGKSRIFFSVGRITVCRSLAHACHTSSSPHSLPNVGKSSLTNLLAGDVHAEAANYPFCTVRGNKSASWAALPPEVSHLTFVLAPSYCYRRLTPMSCNALSPIRNSSTWRASGNLPVLFRLS